MYAYIGLAYYEQDLDNEYKERMEAEDERIGTNDVGRIDDSILRNARNTRQQTTQENTK